MDPILREKKWSLSIFSRYFHYIFSQNAISTNIEKDVVKKTSKKTNVKEPIISTIFGNEGTMNCINEHIKRPCNVSLYIVLFT